MQVYRSIAHCRINFVNVMLTTVVLAFGIFIAITNFLKLNCSVSDPKKFFINSKQNESIDDFIVEHNWICQYPGLFMGITSSRVLIEVFLIQILLKLKLEVVTMSQDEINSRTTQIFASILFTVALVCSCSHFLNKALFQIHNNERKRLNI